MAKDYIEHWTEPTGAVRPESVLCIYWQPEPNLLIGPARKVQPGARLLWGRLLFTGIAKTHRELGQIHSRGQYAIKAGIEGSTQIQQFPDVVRERVLDPTPHQESPQRATAEASYSSFPSRRAMAGSDINQAARASNVLCRNGITSTAGGMPRSL